MVNIVVDDRVSSLQCLGYSRNFGPYQVTFASYSLEMKFHKSCQYVDRRAGKSSIIVNIIASSILYEVLLTMFLRKGQLFVIITSPLLFFRLMIIYKKVGVAVELYLLSKGC